MCTGLLLDASGLHKTSPSHPGAHGASPSPSQRWCARGISLATLVCTGLLLGNSGVHEASSRQPKVCKGVFPDKPSMQHNTNSSKTQSAVRIAFMTYCSKDAAHFLAQTDLSSTSNECLGHSRKFPEIRATLVCLALPPTSLSGPNPMESRSWPKE